LGNQKKHNQGNREVKLIEPLLQHLKEDISLLQLNIQLGDKAGFTNHRRLIEALSIHLFKALGIADLKNKNQIQVNFPAIDSADDSGNGIALQVTTNADTTKIKKTIAVFEKADSSGESVKDRYEKLYIFGFCKAATKTKVPNYCEVVDTGFLINELIDKNDEAKVQLVLDAIHQHIDYSRLHPYDDISCLRIMLGFIGRNAVRHLMSCEGSIDDMTKGLKELSELIGKGTVDGKLKSKAQHQFSDPVINVFLSDTLNNVSKILAIVNKAARPDGFVYLPMDAMERIDQLKRSITIAAQDIARENAIYMSLEMHEVD
jgi:hypothetical protein